ncbi:MAG: XdhC family protein [Gemmatimonadota bacterium]|nr:MAG: XdhC family protein [Gemmatimonadota bacterium]
MSGDVDQSHVSAAEAAAHVLAAQERGEASVVVTVVDAPSPEHIGRHLLMGGGSPRGKLGKPVLDERAAELARAALLEARADLHELELEGATWKLYVESQQPVPELLIIGAGHIARPLCRIGALVGFRVTVADDRPEFANREWFPEAERIVLLDYQAPFEKIEIRSDTYVVLVTRGHKYDYDCIHQLLRLDARPAYLGMIGSRRRVRAAFEALLDEGCDPERLAQVHAPIGLDIGAEAPEEIALAIAAEIVAARRGGAGGRLSDEQRVFERVARRREDTSGGAGS